MRVRFVVPQLVGGIVLTAAVAGSAAGAGTPGPVVAVAAGVSAGVVWWMVDAARRHGRADAARRPAQVPDAGRAVAAARVQDRWQMTAVQVPGPIQGRVYESTVSDQVDGPHPAPSPAPISAGLAMLERDGHTDQLQLERDVNEILEVVAAAGERGVTMMQVFRVLNEKTNRYRLYTTALILQEMCGSGQLVKPAGHTRYRVAPGGVR